MDKRETLYELEKSLIAELEERKEEITKAEDSYEVITEIINGLLPVYTASALEVALSDLWLAVDKPEFGDTPYEGIISNISSHLHEKAQEWDNNNQ